MVMAFLAFIEAQNDDNQVINESDVVTEMGLTCIVNNITYRGDECLEGLNKFGRIVSYIVMGFVLIVVACCCCCWCCLCKIIHGHGKRRSPGGVVLAQAPHHAPVITTVA
jgi:hypothetical protein